MGWQTTGDVAEFLAAAGGFLRAERARNTVFLTVTETMRENPERYVAGGLADPAGLPLFGWWTPGAPGTGATGATVATADVSGAFLHTPPFPLLLTAVPAGTAATLAATLAGRPLAGVNGYQDTADAFAAARRKLTGCRVDVHRRTRLHRLEELTWPDPPPSGSPRLADHADTGLLTSWFTAFAREVDDLDGGADTTAAVRERLSHRGLTLWEEGGGPVSLAGLTRQVAGMVRVGPVYTPPELRGHGYASAVTAAVTEQARAEGAEEVLLYTDLANPVSNSIYRRIGYRPVEDRVVLSFTETATGAS